MWLHTRDASSQLTLHQADHIPLSHYANQPQLGNLMHMYQLYIYIYSWYIVDMYALYIYIYSWCICASPMAREIWVQSQVESYQRLKKWYLMPPCLTLSIIRYGSRVKWSTPGKGVAPSPTPWCSKLSKREPSGHPRLWSPILFYFTYISTIYIYIYVDDNCDIYSPTPIGLSSLAKK